MHRAYIISLLVLAIMVGFLADRQPDTSAELLPLASALGWIENDERALQPELIGAGIRPAHVVQIGNNFLPRTSPVMFLHYGTVCRIYRNRVDRPLDGVDIPKLNWWINFLGALPWVLLLFAGLHKLTLIFGVVGGVKSVWASWGAMAGSLAFGWFGTASHYLPVAAVAVWIVALLLPGRKNRSITRLIIAGILAGISGAFHPSGWIWVIWGIFLLVISSPDDQPKMKQISNLVAFSLSAVVCIFICLLGNWLFFGTILPVQWIDLQPIQMAPSDIFRLLWHDLIGWNGLIWLSPLLPIGLIALYKNSRRSPVDGIAIFLFGLIALTLFLWGVADDARLMGEIDSIHPQLSVLPIELTNSRFQLVYPEHSPESPEDRQAEAEQLVERTDIFLWFGGRSPGLPILLPIAVILSLYGLCAIGVSRFMHAWTWVGIRIGGLSGLIMSQAAYGNVSQAYPYVGNLGVGGHVPILEGLFAVSIRLAELWPDAHIIF